ncbi:Mitochondrial distribution and morphology protein 12 [Smittium mucronatum]|uniref:Mitochondrial distribution and morphology protein 12 n=1 Tax=Smittium mucronatum TaxID=133383 RepID=A0A1R0H8L9_9FUNG|nr:Mitochondrial distribution and morphology protein 12 [Smittium mucronatum]
MYFKLAYSGDCSLTLNAELQLNYPASSFIALPITFNVTNLKFSATAVVAYLTNRVSFAFLEPEPPRTSLLDDLSIKSQIGDDHHHGKCL